MYDSFIHQPNNSKTYCILFNRVVYMPQSRRSKSANYLTSKGVPRGLSLNGPLGTPMNGVQIPKRPPPARLGTKHALKMPLPRPAPVKRPSPKKVEPVKKMKPPPVRRTRKSISLSPPSPQSDKSSSPNFNYPGRNPLFKRYTGNEPYPANRPGTTRRFARISKRFIWADEPDYRNI